MQVKVYQNKADAVAVGSNRSGEIWVEVDVAKLSEAQRKELAGRIGFHEVALNLGQYTQDETGVVTWLDELIGKAAQEKKQRAKQVEATVQKLLAMPQNHLNEYYISDYGSDPERLAMEDPRLADKAAARSAYAKAEKERRAAEKVDQQAREEQRATEREIAREKREHQTTTWVETHGSERLKLALAGGYKCNSLYLRERIALELGEGWVVDTGDKAEVEERCAPSLGALLIVKGLPQGYAGQVVWLATSSQMDDEDREPCEAVEVTLPYSGHKAYKT